MNEDREAQGAACEAESVRTPGAIQPHGALLVIDTGPIEAVCCSVVSANVDDFVGVSAEQLLTRPLAELLGAAWTAEVCRAEDGDAVRLDAARGPHEAVVRLSGGRRFVEIEPLTDVELDDHWRLYNALRAFHGATAVDELLDQAVRTVATITGFDRVLIYRFDETWNSEVVAEMDGPGSSSLLGLRFPEADIPAQVRALYVQNRLRIIPDTHADPVPLLAVEDVDLDALDLSDVGLRALSPMNLLYDRSMGVRASMSAAIVVEGALWGLISCHRLAEPRRLSLRARNAVDLVARTTSTVLAVLLDGDEARRRLGYLQYLDRLGDLLTQQARAEPDDVLLDADDLVLDIVDATGAAVVSGRGVRTRGECPPEDVIGALIDEARLRPSRQLVENELAAMGDQYAAHREVAAGAIVVPVTGPEHRWLLWFRPETASTVRWARDPHRERGSGPDPDDAAESGPRTSFEEYIEVVRGKSVPWTDQEVEAALLVARRLGDQYAGQAVREAEVAVTLQRTLMLERFPEAPGIDGAAHYVPSRREPIGGDWYDVIFRPRRNPTLVLGDVAGHGAEAAATMAQLRHALRAYILRAPSVAVAVTRLNDLITQALPKEMATSIVAEMDPMLRRITMVNAGHLPPVLIDADGARLVETDRGLALGIRATESYRASTVGVPAGGALVVYSDGLIESRSHTIDEGLELLVEEAGKCAALGSSEEIAARIAERVGSHSDTDDDLTVVVVRFVDPEAEVEEVAIEVASG